MALFGAGLGEIQGPATRINLRTGFEYAKRLLVAGMIIVWPEWTSGEKLLQRAPYIFMLR